MTYIQLLDEKTNTNQLGIILLEHMILKKFVFHKKWLILRIHLLFLFQNGCYKS